MTWMLPFALLLLLVVGVGFGWAVWRYRIIHSTLKRDWENNPLALRQVELLEAIARHTAPRERRWDRGQFVDA